MSTATYAVQLNLFGDGVKKFNLSREFFVMILLSLAVLGSAVSVIYEKNLERRYVSDLQSMQHKHEKQQVEYGQLLLEQSTWSTQARVQRIAQQRLGMEIAKPSNIVVIKL